MIIHYSIELHRMLEPAANYFFVAKKAGHDTKTTKREQFMKHIKKSIIGIAALSIMGSGLAFANTFSAVESASTTGSTISLTNLTSCTKVAPGKYQTINQNAKTMYTFTVIDGIIPKVYG